MKLIFFFVFIFSLPGYLDAQNSSTDQKKLYNSYNEALVLSQQGNSLKSKQILLDIVRKDATFYRAYFALADLCHEAGMTQEEIGHLEKGLSLAGDTYASGFKFLAEALFKSGAYDEALPPIEHFARLKDVLTSGERLLLESCRFSVMAIHHPVPFQPIDPGDSINTVAEEYWPSMNADASKLVFTRLVTKDKNGQKVRRPQEDFYSSKRDSSGWHLAMPIGAPINTEENEGAQTISADGRLLIFTGCGRSDGFGSCDLYISVNKNGHWSIPVNMGEPVNSGAWEAQPALSADGQTLYFVSSRTGGKGKMDIWKAQKMNVSDDGVPWFGNVSNVAELNTPGNDLSPFLHADGKTIFFASDGRPGLGGNDLFRSILKDGKWSEPRNMGYPINTRENEEGLVVETSGERAWFSSVRNPLRGKDIFYFDLPDSLRPDAVSYLKGVVVDAKSGIRIKSDIVLTNLKTNQVVNHITMDENEGEFLVCLPVGKDYGLNISRKGYLFASENIPLEKIFTNTNPKTATIRLQPVVVGAITTLHNIFFETNSWQLKVESQVQLDEMARFMIQNPEVTMEIVGHTDRVGSEAYNLELSRKRAESVAAELLNRKIERTRLLTRGAGFSEPIGDNLTEEGRGANRRTEFVVKKL